MGIHNRPGGFRVLNEDIDMTTITTTTNAQELKGVVAPLYHQYPAETLPQPAFIELDCEEASAEAKWTGEVGGGVPAYVWHKRAIRFSVPSEIRGDVIADFMESEKFQALAQRICAGYVKRWDGNNHVGRYSDDAAEAREELQQVIADELYDESAYVQITSPEDYWANEFAYSEDETAVVFNLHDGAIRVTSETTDKELSALSRKLEDLTDDGVEYTSDVMGWLEGLRDSLFEASDEKE